MALHINLTKIIIKTSQNVVLSSNLHFSLDALDYLIAFGYFAKFEILYHLLYVISSTLKE